MTRVREWKAGDFRLFVDDKARRHTWRTPAELVHGDPFNGAYDYRPLVVIDPEDREQAARLLSLYGDQYTSWTPDTDGPNVDRLQAALREFANPTPPIEEPTGLGAVVEDAKGDTWVLVDVTGADVKPTRQWRAWWGNRPWSEIAAVRVLSEGVPTEAVR